MFNKFRKDSAPFICFCAKVGYECGPFGNRFFLRSSTVRRSKNLKEKSELSTAPMQ